MPLIARRTSCSKPDTPCARISVGRRSSPGPRRGGQQGEDDEGGGEAWDGHLAASPGTAGHDISSDFRLATGRRPLKPKAESRKPNALGLFGPAMGGRRDRRAATLNRTAVPGPAGNCPDLALVALGAGEGLVVADAEQVLEAGVGEARRPRTRPGCGSARRQNRPGQDAGPCGRRRRRPARDGAASAVPAARREGARSPSDGTSRTAWCGACRSARTAPARAQNRAGRELGCVNGVAAIARRAHLAEVHVGVARGHAGDGAGVPPRGGRVAAPAVAAAAVGACAGWADGARGTSRTATPWWRPAKNSGRAGARSPPP